MNVVIEIIRLRTVIYTPTIAPWIMTYLCWLLCRWRSRFESRRLRTTKNCHWYYYEHIYNFLNGIGSFAYTCWFGSWSLYIINFSLWEPSTITVLKKFSRLCNLRWLVCVLGLLLALKEATDESQVSNANSSSAHQCIFCTHQVLAF
jgi:hypothetical protein